MTQTSEGVPPASRRRQVTVICSLVALLGAFGIYQLFLGVDMQSNNCELTPPGYFSQTLVDRERHLLWYDCVLDPGNGEPRYTIHRPWQSVKNANGDDSRFN